MTRELVSNQTKMEKVVFQVRQKYLPQWPRRAAEAMSSVRLVLGTDTKTDPKMYFKNIMPKLISNSLKTI